MCLSKIIFTLDGKKINIHDTINYDEMYGYLLDMNYIKYYGSAGYIFKLIDENGVLIDNLEPNYDIHRNSVAMTQDFIEILNKISLEKNGELLLKNRIDEFTKDEFINILRQLGCFSEVHKKKCYADYLSWMQDGRTFKCSTELADFLDIFEDSLLEGKNIVKMLIDGHIEEIGLNQYKISERMKNLIKYEELSLSTQRNYRMMPYYLVRDICRKHLTLVSEEE